MFIKFAARWGGKIKSVKIILSVALVCGLAACEKPVPENPPEPKAPANAAADALAAMAVSTPAPVRNNGLLNAPGNYLKNTTGQIDRAKNAVKTYEKAAAEHMNTDGSN